MGLTVFCKAGRMLSGWLAVLRRLADDRLADSLFNLAGWASQELAAKSDLAGNPVTRIPDFVQPCTTIVLIIILIIFFSNFFLGCPLFETIEVVWFKEYWGHLQFSKQLRSSSILNHLGSSSIFIFFEHYMVFEPCYYISMLISIKHTATFDRVISEIF